MKLRTRKAPKKAPVKKVPKRKAAKMRAGGGPTHLDSDDGPELSLESLLRQPSVVLDIDTVRARRDGACTTLSGYGPRDPLEGDD